VGEEAQVQLPRPPRPGRQGDVALRPADALPDLPRDQVPIASNLIIDREGIIRFFTLLDSANFDARLVALRTRLDELLAAKP